MPMSLLPSNTFLGLFLPTPPQNAAVPRYCHPRGCFSLPTRTAVHSLVTFDPLATNMFKSSTVALVLPRTLNSVSWSTPVFQECVSHTCCPLRVLMAAVPPTRLRHPCRGGSASRQATPAVALDSPQLLVPVSAGPLHSQLPQHLTSVTVIPLLDSGKVFATCPSSIRLSVLQPVWSLHNGNLVSTAQAKSGLHLVFVNKDSLNHSLAHCWLTISCLDICPME